MTASRLAAARALLAIDAGQTTLAAEVETGRSTLADRRDRALLLDLVAGTLRWRNAIDAVIGKVSGRTIADLEPEVLAVLRMGVYQLRYLDRIPAHAVVHESVEAARAMGRVRAHGFVNAVLRGIIRAGTSTTLPSRPDSPDDREAALAYLSTTLSHPRWLAARWLDRYGLAAAEAWCRFNNETPGVTVRPAPGASRDALLAALAEAEVAAQPARFAAHGIQLPPGAIGRLPDDIRRLLFIQDEGSQIVAEVADVQPGERVLDLCAAPGGKTVAMASSAGPHGTLVACDMRRSRVRLLAQTLASARHAAPDEMRSLGQPPRIVQLDASRPLPFPATFDRVFVDAPCTGLGTLRRDPDVKWSRQPEDLARLAILQNAILTQAATAVRPGGVLVYATCSSEPEENGDRVRDFLRSNPEFVWTRLQTPRLPIDPDGALETRPDRDGLDAYYAVVLARHEST